MNFDTVNVHVRAGRAGCAGRTGRAVHIDKEKPICPFNTLVHNVILRSQLASVYDALGNSIFTF